MAYEAFEDTNFQRRTMEVVEFGEMGDRLDEIKQFLNPDD